MLGTSFDCCQGQSGSSFFTTATTSSGSKVGYIRGIQCTIQANGGKGKTYVRSINKARSHGVSMPAWLSAMLPSRSQLLACCAAACNPTVGRDAPNVQEVSALVSKWKKLTEADV